ncbi:MAG: signal peptide peptidase SppA [Acidobacteriota bacterium]
MEPPAALEAPASPVSRARRIVPPPIIPGRPSGPRPFGQRPLGAPPARRRFLPRFLLVMLLASLVGGGTLFVVMLRGGRTSSGYLALEIGAEIPEEAPAVIFGNAPATTYDVERALVAARDQERIKGLLLNVKSGPGGIARIQALRRAIERFKTSGKPVVAFMESASLGQYYLATAASEVVMVPTGDLHISGLSAEMGFMRGTFDLLGIQPDFYHAGKFKSYAEQYTEKKMSDANREATTALVDDVYEQIVASIARDRKKTPEEVRALIDRGPFTAREALQAGLIDAASYWDEVEKKHNGGKDGELDTVPIKRFVPKDALPFGGLGGNRIALVYETGQINGGHSQEDPLFGGKTMGSDTITDALREIRRDDGIKAVVFRVDSPGGSALASDVIWREVELIKKAGKPVIVSMGDVAASGGYYISTGADVIVAEPGTITGSIGVVTGKFALQGLYDKIGYSTDAVTRGQNAGIDSSTHPFSESQQEVIVRQMEAVYTDFVDRVCQGRKRTREEIEEVAQGRVWTGNQAKEIGLVDEIGGLDRAIEIAKEKAKIPAGTKVHLAIYPHKKTFFETLIDQETQTRAPQLPDAVKDALRLASTVKLFEKETSIVLMPLELHFR